LHCSELMKKSFEKISTWVPPPYCVSSSSNFNIVFASSNETLAPDEISKVSSNVEENKRKESVSSRKVDSPMVLNMTLHDDEISQGESEIMESSRPPTTRSRLPSQTGLFKQLFNGMSY
jgi:hypothetical protein